MIGSTFSQTIAEDISLECADTVVFLVVGPCRSGTTAFLRVFSEVGIQSWYQPIKAVIRGRMRGGRNLIQIPDLPRVMLKETFGPFAYEETCFNPIEILLEAGVVAGNIHLVTLTREPTVTASSWIRINRSVGESTDAAALSWLAKGYHNVLNLAEFAESLGINHTPLVYELLRDHDPEVVRSRLFARLRIAQPPGRMRWDALSPIESDGDQIKFCEQGRRYFVPELHTRLNESVGLTYFGKSAAEIAQYVDDGHIAILAAEGAFERYQMHKTLSMAAFNLPVHADLVNTYAG